MRWAELATNFVARVIMQVARKDLLLPLLSLRSAWFCHARLPHSRALIVTAEKCSAKGLYGVVIKKFIPASVSRGRWSRWGAEEESGAVLLGSRAHRQNDGMSRCNVRY
jgi:hypothetical protein